MQQLDPSAAFFFFFFLLSFSFPRSLARAILSQPRALFPPLFACRFPGTVVLPEPRFLPGPRPSPHAPALAPRFAARPCSGHVQAGWWPQRGGSAGLAGAVAPPVHWAIAVMSSQGSAVGLGGARGDPCRWGAPLPALSLAPAGTGAGGAAHPPCPNPSLLAGPFSRARLCRSFSARPQPLLREKHQRLVGMSRGGEPSCPPPSPTSKRHSPGQGGRGDGDDAVWFCRRPALFPRGGQNESPCHPMGISPRQSWRRAGGPLRPPLPVTVQGALSCSPLAMAR